MELTVTLTHEDISEIANDMNNAFSGEKPSQGYLEWLLCGFIKKRKGIDFFEEKCKTIEQEEENRKDSELTDYLTASEIDAFP